ncbi:ABC transporter substrate-binding protein [Glaesserella sp.]|uniref:ABC transporter substrate-binding protein n=1 Tax=Glaesserella sp. TaxID=2094731 RepID=UPI0035A005E0
MMFNISKKLTTLCLTAMLVLSAHAKIIEDVKGNRVEVPDEVTRIADLWHANNQIVLLLGGANKLVATTTNIQTSAWFNEVYPNIKNVPALTNGQTIQMEELLKQNPQVVLLSNPTMYEEVTRAGLAAVNASFQDFDGLKRTVKLTAEVIGDNAPQIANAYLAELDGNIQFVAERIKNVEESQKPNVMHITSSANILKIDGGKSMIGDWIVKTGGRNAFPDTANMIEVNMEDILAANPDVIIIGSQNAQKGIEQIKKDPTWQSISAVKSGRIYANPLGTFPWDRYSAEEALQILWASQLFHPELFKDVNMVEKTQQFYKKYYNYMLSEENAKRILQGLDPAEK